MSGRQRILIEDATVALVEFVSGAQGMLQSSYIAVGNYPGVEIRVYGSKGAAVARLITEFGIAEQFKFAPPRRSNSRTWCWTPRISRRHTLATHGPELYYRNLIRYFVDEILEDRAQECTFYDARRVSRSWMPSSPHMPRGGGLNCRQESRVSELGQRFLNHHLTFRPVDGTFMGRRDCDRLLPRADRRAAADEARAVAELTAAAAAAPGEHCGRATRPAHRPRRTEPRRGGQR